MLSAIFTWGTQADNKPWTIGIAKPDNAQLSFSYMNVTDMAVATSGIDITKVKAIQN